MAKLTMVFGGLLAIVGLGFWVAMSRSSSAALHPAGLGILLLVCGALANTESTKQRMIWMHIAVTLGLIGLLISGIHTVAQMAHGLATLDSPLPFYEHATTAAVCLVFVTLCVRSFIAARRTRVA